MSGVLFLLPGTGPDRSILWARCVEGGEIADCGRLSDVGQLDTLAAIRDNRVCVLMPGTTVRLHHVAIPAKSEAQARAALPYLLEDELAVEPDTIHAALGETGRNGKRLAVVMNQNEMASWIETLAKAGISPDVMLPDFLAFDTVENEGQVHILDGRAIITLPGKYGFSVEPDWLPAILPPVAADAEVASIVWQPVGDEVSAPDDALAPLTITQKDPISEREFWARMHPGLVARPPVNMLQGRFAPRRRQSVSRDVLKRAVILLSAVGIGYLALLLSEGWWYERQADRLHAEAERVFRETFPDVNRIVNPRAQMQARLALMGGGTSAGFIETVSVLIDSLRHLDTARVQTLRFDADRGSLSAELVYQSFEDMEAVKKAVAERGGRLEEGGSREGDSGIVGDVTVRLQ